MRAPPCIKIKRWRTKDDFKDLQVKGLRLGFSFPSLVSIYSQPLGAFPEKGRLAGIGNLPS